MNEIQGMSEEQIEEINEAIIKFAEKIRQFLTELVEIHIQFMVEIGRAIDPLVEKLFEWILDILDFQLRLKLNDRLLKWRIPKWIALRIAKHLPRRVLFLVVT